MIESVKEEGWKIVYSWYVQTGNTLLNYIIYKLAECIKNYNEHIMYLIIIINKLNKCLKYLL